MTGSPAIVVLQNKDQRPYSQSRFKDHDQALVQVTDEIDIHNAS